MEAWAVANPESYDDTIKAGLYVLFALPGAVLLVHSLRPAALWKQLRVETAPERRHRSARG